MDYKDEAIIKILARQAHLPSRVLSKMTGLPISTVHNRIQRLEAAGVIKGYKALINFENV
ncbi:MAG: winged helix-turn-helix transcriptional regulator [Candidatus Bathyarchaeia archaeon]